MKVSVETSISLDGKQFTIPEFLAFRQKIGTLRSSKSTLDSELKTKLNAAYKHFSDVTDSLIAKAIGASQITALSGRGFQPDFISIDNNISEAKSITVKLNESGNYVANDIKLGNLAIGSIKDIGVAGVQKTLLKSST